MKRARSYTETIDVPVALAMNGAVWSATLAVRMSRRTETPVVCDVIDLQRFQWGTSYQFDIADAPCAEVIAIMEAGRAGYLECTSEGVEERAT